jgi:hypothetical protein
VLIATICSATEYFIVLGTDLPLHGVKDNIINIESVEVKTVFVSPTPLEGTRLIETNFSPRVPRTHLSKLRAASVTLKPNESIEELK